MVKISYCPSCEKAHRFHLTNRAICGNCKERYEIIEIKRTKYFLIQLPMLLIGFAIICFSIFFMITNRERLAEPIGMSILGFSILLFALAFQIMDNKLMEEQGKEIGDSKYSKKIENERVPANERFKTFHKPAEPLLSTKLQKKEHIQPTITEFFSKPNRPETIVKKPRQTMNTEPIRIAKLTNIIKTKPEKKRARKIRKAI